MAVLLRSCFGGKMMGHCTGGLDLGVSDRPLQGSCGVVLFCRWGQAIARGLILAVRGRPLQDSLVVVLS